MLWVEVAGGVEIGHRDPLRRLPRLVVGRAVTDGYAEAKRRKGLLLPLRSPVRRRPVEPK